MGRNKPVVSCGRGGAWLLPILVALFNTIVGGCDSPRRGSVGETCRARNDCRDGLVCFREVCTRASTDLSATGRSCYRVECAEDADCCASFRPDPSCDFYRMACEADPRDCATFNALCVCNLGCSEERCLDRGPTCAVDADCPSFSSPFCTAGRCAECRESADCPGDGGTCVAGTCRASCTRDEQCALLERCEAGTCVESGCTSDRECAFLLGDGRARCADGECFVACTDDTECDLSAFETCAAAASGGRCAFAGCETDTECRALLRLTEEDRARAVCR